MDEGHVLLVRMCPTRCAGGRRKDFVAIHRISALALTVISDIWNLEAQNPMLDWTCADPR